MSSTPIYEVELTADEIGALVTSTSIALDNLTRKAMREGATTRIGSEAARQAGLLNSALTQLREVQLEIIGSEEN